MQQRTIRAVSLNSIGFNFNKCCIGKVCKCTATIAHYKSQPNHTIELNLTIEVEAFPIFLSSKYNETLIKLFVAAEQSRGKHQSGNV